MKFLSVATLVAAAASTVNAIIVNTPASAVECQPLLITWDPEGSAGPFFLSVVPGDRPSAAALFSWSDLTGTSFTWVVAQPAGTSLGLLLRDEIGATSQSAPFTVQNGTSDCLTSSSGSVSLPSGSSSLPASSSSSLSPVTRTSTPTTTPTSTRVSTPITSPSSVRSSSSSSSSPTTTAGNSAGNTSGGVINNAVNFGTAGLLAALLGAILA